MNWVRSVLVVCSALVGSWVMAAEAINTFGKNTPLFGNPERTGVAIRGYDTVSYFTENKAQPGKDEFVTEWKGARWKFTSRANLELFKANPDKFAPQYGGYCAYGASKGYLVKVEPDQFAVLDGKLYLNYDADVQKKWSADPKGYIKAADENFVNLLKR